MNKKILAVAVAGALAAPGLALAQASVTISGYVKVAVSNTSFSNANAARAGLNTSEWRMVDDGPTRLAFDMRDDLGGGLVGIAKLELRPTIDGNSAVNGGGNGAGFGSSSGNQWIGLESREMGTIRLGSIDQHYTIGVDTGAVYGPTLVSSAVVGQIYVGTPTAASNGGALLASLAGGSRTRNLIRWDSPAWGGFRLGVGYSFNLASGFEGDLATGGRKGGAWNLNPSFTAANWRVLYSYLDDKRDAAITVTPGTAATGVAGATAQNWKGHRLAGDVKFGDFTVGLQYDRTKIDVVTLGTGATAHASDRNAWVLPVKWQMGKHIVTGAYGVAGKDKVMVGTPDTSAKQWAVSYAYLFSPRTSIGVGYTVIKNAAFGAYSINGDNGTGVTGLGQNGYNSANAASYVGERVQAFGVSMRQSF